MAAVRDSRHLLDGMHFSARIGIPASVNSELLSSQQKSPIAPIAIDPKRVTVGVGNARWDSYFRPYDGTKIPRVRGSHPYLDEAANGHFCGFSLRLLTSDKKTLDFR